MSGCWGNPVRGSVYPADANPVAVSTGFAGMAYQLEPSRKSLLLPRVNP
jgi:hypothetical protein